MKVDKGIQGYVGAKGDRGERGERGVKGEKSIQGDNSVDLSVLADHLPIQLATRHGEKMCLIKYHVSEDRSSIIELSGGVETLRSVSAYYEPVCILVLNLSNVQKASGHGHYLEMKNSAVNVIYIVYKIRKYDRGICFLKDEKTMRVYGAAGKPDYMDYI